MKGALQGAEALQGLPGASLAPLTAPFPPCRRVESDSDVEAERDQAPRGPQVRPSRARSHPAAAGAAYALAARPPAGTVTSLFSLACTQTVRRIIPNKPRPARKRAAPSPADLEEASLLGALPLPATAAAAAAARSPPPPARACLHTPLLSHALIHRHREAVSSFHCGGS